MNDASTVNVTGNVQGSVGATGPQGPQGIQGNQGATGAQGAGLNDVSVTTASNSGSGNLTYNSGSGVFTFTPPDLSSYLTNISGQTLNDLSGVSVASASSGQVLKYNGSVWEPATDATGSGGISSLVADTSPQLGGTLDANGNTIDMGSNILTDANLGNFITAYGWGNHASSGYLTSLAGDSTPQLGGSLDVNGHDIASANLSLIHI